MIARTSAVATTMPVNTPVVSKFWREILDHIAQPLVADQELTDDRRAHRPRQRDLQRAKKNGSSEFQITSREITELR